jgi:hypothetical protein
MNRVDDLVEIYQAHAGDHAAEVLKLLYRAGISAECEYRPDTPPNQRNAIVLIKVPEDLTHQAAQVICEWENQQAADVNEHATVARPRLWLIAIGVVLFAAMVLRGATAEVPAFVWLSGIAFLVAAAAVRTMWRRHHPLPRGHCETCGYNLRGNRSGRCPECGTAITGRRSRVK